MKNQLLSLLIIPMFISTIIFAGGTDDKEKKTSTPLKSTLITKKKSLPPVPPKTWLDVVKPTNSQEVGSTESTVSETITDKATESETPKKKKTRKPVVPKQDGMLTKAWHKVYYRGDRVQKALDILAMSDIPEEWADQYRNSIGWGITDLVDEMTTEDKQHTLNELRGLQDSLDNNQSRIEKLQLIIKALTEPRINKKGEDEKSLLRINEDQLLNADNILTRVRKLFYANSTSFS